MDADDLVSRELMWNRFRRLMGEIRRGAILRQEFQPWEIDVLRDIESCHLRSRRKERILQQYQRAVEHQLEMGPGPPMKLSEFLTRKARRSGSSI
jgi:hypothetical protein